MSADGRDDVTESDIERMHRSLASSVNKRDQDQFPEYWRRNSLSPHDGEKEPSWFSKKDIERMHQHHIPLTEYPPTPKEPDEISRSDIERMHGTLSSRREEKEPAWFSPRGAKADLKGSLSPHDGEKEPSWFSKKDIERMHQHHIPLTEYPPTPKEPDEISRSDIERMHGTLSSRREEKEPAWFSPRGAKADLEEIRRRTDAYECCEASPAIAFSPSPTPASKAAPTQVQDRQSGSFRR